MPLTAVTVSFERGYHLLNAAFEPAAVDRGSMSRWRPRVDCVCSEKSSFLEAPAGKSVPFYEMCKTVCSVTHFYCYTVYEIVYLKPGHWKFARAIDVEVAKSCELPKRQCLA